MQSHLSYYDQFVRSSESEDKINEYKPDHEGVSSHKLNSMANKKFFTNFLYRYYSIVPVYSDSYYSHLFR